MRRLLLTSLLVGIIIFILAAPVPAWAQGGWTLDADFTSGALPYFLTFGNANPCGTAQSNYIDTAGVHSVLSDCFGGEFRVRLEFNFGVNTHVTRIDMYISGECHPKFRYLFTSATGNLLLTDQGSGHWLWTGDTFMSDGTGQGMFESQEAPADSSPPGCNITWTSLHLEGYSAAPATYTPGFTPTSTQAPTPTSTPNYYTPIPQTPQPPETCTTPDTRSASFRSGQQWTFSGGADYAVPLPQQFLRLPPGGSASMSVNLSDAEYKLKVVYQSSGLGGGSFIASIGGQPYTIRPPDSAEHTFETDPIHYPTGATPLELSKPATDSVDVTVKFFCLSAVQSSGGAITTGGDKNDQCETCDPPISIGDIPGILNWILCNIRRLWTCYLLPILTSILSFIGTIIKFILSFFDWIVRGIGGILNWIAGLISSAWGSITGWISNLFAGVNNDFHSSGIADDMNVAASRTRDLPTAIGNGISTLGGQLGQIFTNTGQGLGGFVNFIWRLISFGASAIAYVIGLIPLVIQSFIDGINSASTPPSGSPLCSNPASLAYYPCLGFYVLDNTIFAGPAGYLFPVLVGIIVFYNLVWIFTRIKEELSK